MVAYNNNYCTGVWLRGVSPLTVVIDDVDPSNVGVKSDTVHRTTNKRQVCKEVLNKQLGDIVGEDWDVNAQAVYPNIKVEYDICNLSVVQIRWKQRNTIQLLLIYSSAIITTYTHNYICRTIIIMIA